MEHALSEQDLVSLIEDNRNLATLLASYETRPGQIALLKMITRAFNEQRPLIAEAGTGLGKSLAYLLPALRWAELNEGRVVVSTATIALQQQIVNKDIPLAKKLLGSKVKTSLVKGRGNYLCLKRLEEAGTEDDLFGSVAEMTAIRQWAMETNSGDLSDIPFTPGFGIWGRIRCEGDACPGSLCAHFEKCFFMQSRRRAFTASVIVVNHHLLFADLAARRERTGQEETVVLPAYQCIVFDEAHHIESGATSMFSGTLSFSSLNRLFHRLYRGQLKPEGGLLRKIADVKSGAGESFKTVPALIDDARNAAQSLDTLGRFLFKNSSSIRLNGPLGETERKNFTDPMNNLQNALGNLTADIVSGIEGLKDDEDSEIQGIVIELEQTASSLQKSAGIAEAFIHRETSSDQVFWLELTRSSGGNEMLQCHCTPLEVSDIIRESVWEAFETVISVSATLSMGGRFQAWRSNVGAMSTAADFLEGIYPSPFDFMTRVLLGIPVDAPSPENRGDWEEYLIQTIARSLETSGGHALVLFTSYEVLRSTVSGVRSLLGDEAPLLLAQGEDDRARLLIRFRDNPSSVLFATDSFWEGVDVPGESLRLVIITRLPFRPPTDPIDQARRDSVMASGSNPFLRLTVPAAVMRFRQGFGRLMRRKDDYGAVLVLDARIVSKSYGSLFRDALPRTALSIKTTEGVLRELENFLYQSM